MVMLRRLLLLLVHHAALHLDGLHGNGRLLADLLLELGLLVLLDEIAGRAAASAEQVLAAIALEVVLAADLTAVHHLNDPLAAELGQTEPGTAVAVDRTVSLEIAILVQAVMDSAMNEAWAPPSQATKAQRGAAVSSRVVPIHCKYCGIL